MGLVKTRTMIVISLIGIVVFLACVALVSETTALKQSMADAGTGHRASALGINDKIPDFQADAFYKNDTARLNISDYRGKWLVFIFYPADFTFVCPTELEEMASLYKNFTDEGAEVFSVSRDTPYVHKAWHESDPRISKVQFPMLSDTTGDICKAFGTYNESSGLSHRASFLFDPDGRLKAFEIHDDGFGRNTKELLRELEAAKFVREHQGKVCPAGWKPGEEAIQP